MKTRIFTLIMSLFVAMMAFALECIDGIYYDLNHSDGTAIVRSGARYGMYEGDIVIPNVVYYDEGGPWDRYRVTSIRSYAFYNCPGLTSVIIPSNVTSIGDYAFENTGLTSITIPNKVTSIGTAIFRRCHKLTTVQWNVKELDRWADVFYGCSQITSFTFGDNVESIPSSLCSGMSSLKSITIPSNVISVGKGAFTDCSSLTTVYWDVKKHDGYSGEDRLFIGCNSLTDIIFGDNVKSIPASLCSGISSLKSITISNSVTSIGVGAFSSCTSLTSITIPNSVTSIGGGAFEGCSSLSSITIPNSVTSIGDGAFEGCSSLSSITIPNSVTSIGYGAFTSCSSLTSITIPNSVTSIGEYAFWGCSSLTSITIPNSVTSIGKCGLSGCSSLTSIEVNANNQNYASIDGVLYNKDVTTLICCPGGKTSITIPNSVTSIGYGAFSGCSNLTSITIPNSVTSIGKRAFWECSSLTSITIPNSVTSIGDRAFYYCGCLDTITCLAITPPYIYMFTWSDYNSLLLVPERSLGAYKNHSIWGEFKNIKGFKEKYTISTSVNDEKMGVVLGDGIYEEGTEITLTATANVGYGFVKWSDGNTENPRKVVVAQDSTYTAIFGKLYTVSASVKDEMMGTISGDGEYIEGCEITLTVTAKEGYHFVKWSDGNTENPRTIVVTEDVELTAEFAINQYEVSVTAGKNGYVTGSGTYDYGTEVTIEAVANECYHFVKWSDGNTENPRTIVVVEDIELRAEFELDGTPVDNVDESSVIIYVQDDMVHVEGAETDYHVLDVAGRLIYTGRDAQLSLPRGVYVVVVGDEVEKVVI